MGRYIRIEWMGYEVGRGEEGERGRDSLSFYILSLCLSPC